MMNTLVLFQITAIISKEVWKNKIDNMKLFLVKQLLTLLFICTSFTLVAQDTLTKIDVNASAKLADLNFSEKELEMMLPDLKENIMDFRKMHTLSLDNSVGMSIAQRLTTPTEKQEKIKWKYNKKISMPTNKNEIAFYSIQQLGSLLRNKSITSVELTTFFIERIKKYADTLQCVVSLTESIALEQASKADEELKKGIDRGPLHGIPYGLKDLFAVKNTNTTWGAQPYKDQKIDQDAYVYTRLKEAGGVLVAKFSLGALAMGDYWFAGRTKNPWNTTLGSSGSSAGSASATVAGLVPFAIGTETHGSIISPSHTCGATGLRPTFGSTSRSGAMTLSWSLDKVGPICRSAEDAATVFSFIHGTDGKDESAVNRSFNLSNKSGIKNLRIGYAKNHFERLDSNSQEWGVIKAFREQGIEVQPMYLPDTDVYKFDIIGLVIGAEAAAAFDEFTRVGLDDQMTRQTRYDWPNYFRVSRMIPAVEYVNANRHRSVLMQKMNQAMQEYDVIITPSFGNRQLAITNLTGHPALCMPIGFTKQGTPNSITLLANLFREEELVTVGSFFQKITEHDEKHPDRFKQ
jgi:Asp-tRNA(Asn)/Glu-tRNA(Gln) amidotransferase A subunit family amidase